MRNMSRMSEKLAVRVPANMKRRLKSEARARLLEPADIVREALMFHFTTLDAKAAAKKDEVTA